MLINDINKIEIKKTTLGVVCPKCGGDLSLKKSESSSNKVMKFFSNTISKVYCYECENCKGKFSMF